MATVEIANQAPVSHPILSETVCVNLTLSGLEAVALRTLLGNHITGPSDGMRGLFSGIHTALQDAGIPTGLSYVDGNDKLYFGPASRACLLQEVNRTPHENA